MSLSITGLFQGTRRFISATAKDQLLVFGTTQTEQEQATDDGEAYNINSGVIGLTSSTASGVLYFKNNETKAFVVDTLIIGIGSAGTTSDVSTVTWIDNPTAGTLISGASAVPVNRNRFSGSSNALTDSLAYKGAEGNTVTDGDDWGYAFVGSPRTSIPLGLELPKGRAIAITIDTNTTSGTTNVYAAISGHLKTQ